MIEVKSVSKHFGKQPVLKSIHLSIEKGEIFCLLGPSGAGKTTLIRLICGAIPPDTGEIVIDGTKIPNLQVMKRIGFMPQNDALYTDLSGKDNLAFFGGLFELKGSLLAQRSAEVLNLVGLTDDADKLVSKYSGGMKKRLSLAVALLHNPDILILDEPTVGIDPVLRRSIWNEFQTLKNAGKTLIVTTHVMDEVTNCDRAGLIYNGKVIACGDVKTLLASTKSGSIEELFFNSKEEGEKK